MYVKSSIDLTRTEKNGNVFEHTTIGTILSEYLDSDDVYRPITYTDYENNEMLEAYLIYVVTGIIHKNLWRLESLRNEYKNTLGRDEQYNQIMAYVFEMVRFTAWYGKDRENTLTEGYDKTICVDFVEFHMAGINTTSFAMFLSDVPSCGTDILRCGKCYDVPFSFLPTLVSISKYLMVVRYMSNITDGKKILEHPDYDMTQHQKLFYK